MTPHYISFPRISPRRSGVWSRFTLKLSLFQPFCWAKVYASLVAAAVAVTITPPVAGARGVALAAGVAAAGPIAVANNRSVSVSAAIATAIATAVAVSRAGAAAAAAVW